MNNIATIPAREPGAVALPPSLPTLSRNLRWALMTDTVPVDTGSGVRMVEAPWKAPADVYPKTQREAKRRAELLDEALQQEAPNRVVRVWLTQLAIVRASNKPLDDAKVQIQAIAGLLNFPPVLFTQDTLREAAETVEYFLDYKHLSAFLRGKLRALEAERERCLMLSRPQQRPQPVTQPAERKPEHVAMVSELVKAFKAGNQDEVARLSAALRGA